MMSDGVQFFECFICLVAMSTNFVEMFSVFCHVGIAESFYFDTKCELVSHTDKKNFLNSTLFSYASALSWNSLA